MTGISAIFKSANNK